MGRIGMLLACLFSLTAGALPLPELMKSETGQPVTTVKEWETVRRPEILRLFQKFVFGKRPVERPAALRFEPMEPDRVMVDGKAIRKRVQIVYRGPGGEGRIRVTAFLPKDRKPAPSFVFICNRSGEKKLDWDRTGDKLYWPVEQIIARGYAALAFFCTDVGPDQYNGFTNGVHAVFQPDPKVRTAESWATLSGWAWGASRVMDWIETEPLLDAKRVAVIGHSRGGKTALWAGATDQRFAFVISNNSGCGGAKLNRMDLPKSESLERITTVLPHWFCKNYRAYADDEWVLPVDQHELVALIAPRLVYVASATLDDWAGQPGEFQSALLASPAWTLYGKKGLVGSQTFPAADTPLQGGFVGYHLRTGKHALAPYDWQRYMDFADRHGWNR